MSFYERRLQADIDAIRAEVLAIGEEVERNVGRSVRALLTADDALAYEVVLDDLPVNRRVRALDARCHAFVARHLPSAGPLRFISSVLRMDIGVERIGDYAVSIARQAVQVEADLPPDVSRMLTSMDEQARMMLRQALKAWGDQDVELARATKKLASSMDASLHTAFGVLVEEGERGHVLQVSELFGLLTVFARLERVSDQAKNICEEAVFAATGLTKPPKVYKVLFWEADNAGASLLAESMARRAFPESGHFESAGWSSAAEARPSWAPVMSELGLDGEGIRPSGLDTLQAALDDFHVIVGFGDDTGRPDIPFGSSYLRWSVPADPREASRELSVQIAALMERLRGPDAA